MEVALIIVTISIFVCMWCCLSNIDALLKNADDLDEDE